MTRYTLEHGNFIRNKDRAKAFDDIMSKALEEKINSYTILLFFENRSPMKIVQNKKPFKIVDDGLTRTYIDEWIDSGKGTLVIQTSIHHSMNEVYPHRTVSGNGNMLFHYFSGNFGTGALWRLVSEARGRKRSVPDTVSRFFKQNNFNEIYEIIKVRGENDEYDEEPNYRNFNFSTYMDGKEILNIKRTADEGEYHHIDEEHFDRQAFNPIAGIDRFMRDYPEAHDVRDGEYEGN